jgi:hypothetical protein
MFLTEGPLENRARYVLRDMLAPDQPEDEIT